MFPGPGVRAFANGGYQGGRSGPRFTVGAVAGKRFDARLEYSYTRRSGGSGPRVVTGVSDQVFELRFHMKAYVFVSETPYFAVTDREGSARIEIPAGDYRVDVWHPEIKGGPELTAVRHRIATREESELSFSIEQKRVWTPRRAPSISDPGYR